MVIHILYFREDQFQYHLCLFQNLKKRKREMAFIGVVVVVSVVVGGVVVVGGGVVTGGGVVVVVAVHYNAVIGSCCVTILYTKHDPIFQYFTFLFFFITFFSLLLIETLNYN